MKKLDLYQALVDKRKACLLCEKLGMKNQSAFPEYDTNAVGNWSNWAGNLDAEVMIIGQDFSNQEVFERDKGLTEPKTYLTEASTANDYSTETNFYIREFTKLIGLDIGLPNQKSGATVFLTNAVLCLKEGPMSSKVHSNCVANCGKNFLKPLIDIVQPRVIITFGSDAAQSLLGVYVTTAPELGYLKRSGMKEIFRSAPVYLNDKLMWFSLYHPSYWGRLSRGKIDGNGSQGSDLQRLDWQKVKTYLNS